MQYAALESLAGAADAIRSIEAARVHRVRRRRGSDVAAGGTRAADLQSSGGPSFLGIFRQGLAEQGYLEGRNVVIDYRHGDNQYERLAGLAAEFARRQVAVIAALNSPPALAARAATTTVPIVFMIPDDPVKLGLAVSLSRPGGNATGVSFLLGDLGPKQLGLLRELVPHAKRIGLMVNPHNANVEASKTEVVMAASAIGVDLKVVEASDSREIEMAFAALVDNRVDALVVGPDSMFFNRRVQITTLAARHVLPAIYNAYDYAEAGGLMSYGTSLPEAFRQTGVYAGRIIKGENPLTCLWCNRPSSYLQ